MSSSTTRSRDRGVLAVAATVVLVVSAIAAGVSLVAVGNVSAAPTQVSDCTTIDEPGTYELTDYARTGNGACITITASDVVFDGNGRKVVGFHGIVVDNPAGLENVTVRDVRVGAGFYGTAITFANVTDGVVANATIGASKYTSLSVANSEDFTLRDSHVGGDGFDISADNVTLVDNHVDNFLYESELQGNGAVVRNNTFEAAVGGIQGYYPAFSINGSDNLIANNTIPPAEYGTVGMAVEGTNATVRNNTVVSAGGAPSDYTFPGLEVDGRNHTVVDNIVAEFGGPGIDLNGSDHVVHGNVLVANRVGMVVESRDSLIYDNRLRGEEVTRFPYRYYDPEDPQRNRWNVSARTGENVVGGNTVGGNYYADPDGVGFSEACADEDDDEICDSPNALAYNNTDHLPLADEENASVAYFEVADIVASGSLDVDGETTVTANVTNVGTRSAARTVLLSVRQSDHEARVLARRTVTLEAGETRTLTFDVSFDRTGTDERLVVAARDSSLSKTVTTFFGGGGSDSNVTTYQVDFAAGQPIENLSADRLYAKQDRLLRFAFGNASAGITRKDTAWPSAEIRQCVEYGHIRERANGTAAVTFTVPIYCDERQFTLAVYSTPGEAFFPETADQQVLLNATTDTYGPGEHTITVDLPDGNETGD